MRPFFVIGLASLMVSLILNGCSPSPASTVALPADTSIKPTSTTVPSEAAGLAIDSTLLPTFVPPYPCALETVAADVQSDNICRDESVQERMLAQGDGVLFIEHDYAMGAGCFGSISENIQQLRICTQSTGASQILTNAFVSGMARSPDGQWFAYSTMVLGTPDISRIYRIRSDGTDLQRLDTQGFPEQRVYSVVIDSWTADGWVNFHAWDGNRGIYHARMKGDGSGVYERISYATYTPYPTFPPTAYVPSPTRGTPFVGTPPAPQPTSTPPN